MKSSRIILLLTVLAMFFAANGCQAAPETAAVTSKNDGAFEAALEKTAEDAVTDNDEQTNGSEVYINSFTSSDGNITYTVDLNVPIVTEAVPVLQVRPEEITSERATSIAASLFGDTEMYEYTEEMSKSELEEAILTIRQKLSDYDTILESCGGDEDFADYMVSVYEARLEKYETAYASASDTVEVIPCQWTFYPETHYLEYGDSDSLYIMAQTEMDGIPYVFSACNRNKEDYRIHDIFVYTDTRKITTNEVYGRGLEQPSDNEVESIQAQARTILDEMGLSDWIIDSCKVNDRYLSTGQTAYPITIKALPSYEGIPVVRQEQITSLKTGDAYASNYYYETIEFEFCGGQLTFFEYQAPLEIVNIVNDNISILSVEEIINAFEEQAALDDITAYQTGEEYEAVKVEKAVTDVEFGLTRIRIQNNETDFYLVPAYTFRGTSTLIYANGLKDLYSDETLLVVNAVDGSIINTALGY